MPETSRPVRAGRFAYGPGNVSGIFYEREDTMAKNRYEEFPIETFAILDEIREKYGVTDEELANASGMSVEEIETFRQMALEKKKIH